MSGPAGTGKSVGCLMKIHLAMMKYPGARALIVRKTAASLGSTTLDTWRKHIARDALACAEVQYYGGSPEEPPQYRYVRNGSVVVIGGMDKPSKIMSSEYDLIFSDEATELFAADWESMTSRLRNGRLPYSQLIGACNPDAEHHHLYQRGQSGSLLMMESRHEDNPAYFSADGRVTPAGAAYLAKLDKLTGVRYLRLRRGLWVAAEGLVYESWDPAIHLVDAMPEGWETWTRWWSVDFGYTNPFVLQCWAEDGDGRLWLYREIYMTGRLVEDHASQIMGIVRDGRGEWREPRPRAVICDHDAEDRATLERHIGMGTVAARKSISTGVQAMEARLRLAGDGRPRLYVLRDSLVERDETLAEAGKPTSFATEITGYVWPKGMDGKPRKEVPVDEDNHSMDAGRYVIAQRDLGGMPMVRALRASGR